MSRPKTPLCDKLVARQDEWNAIAMFIEWCSEQHIELSTWVKSKGYHGDWYLIVPGDLEALLYRYFDVDAERVERERRALLDWVRQQQKKKEAEEK